MSNHFITKFSREYSDIESLVNAAIIHDIVKEEYRSYVIERLIATYDEGIFLDPTAIKFNEDGSIEIPKSLRAFKGILRQWAKEKEYLTGEPQIQDHAKIKAPIIAAFCKMIEGGRIIEKGFLSNGEFCKKVCSTYGLKYTDRVRQNFSHEPTTKQRQDVKTYILPNLPVEIKEKIDAEINNKTKLYG